MLNNFISFIKVNDLIRTGETILVAVSGGIDSVCLADLFKRAEYPFAIAHCNFRLRGKESDGDERFVSVLADQLGVPFHPVRFDTNAYATESGESIQMVARKLRYRWFEETMEKNGYTLLATAHHLDDSLETALFNFAKGTGISGVRGILPQKNHIIRPLIGNSGADIQKYAMERGLRWREDASNSSDKYSRNYIRHQVIPQLKKINPALEETFLSTSERLIAVEKVFNKAIDEMRARYLTTYPDHFKIACDWAKDKQDKTLLYELVRPFGFSYKQFTDILKSEATGASFYSTMYWLAKDRGSLVITGIKEPKSKDTIITGDTKTVQDHQWSYAIEVLPIDDFVLIKDPKTACIDADLLEFPLKIRGWQKGDKFQPLGMKGKKKVSDFMIDSKIPVNLKNCTRLLVSGNKIVWVVDWRLDDRFKVTEKTRRVMKIQITGKDA